MSRYEQATNAQDKKKAIQQMSEDKLKPRGEIQGIINQLNTVKAGTTTYAEAQQLLLSAQNKLKS